MLHLLFVMLNFRLCVKANSTKATVEVLKACHGTINALKVDGKGALKKHDRKSWSSETNMHRFESTSVGPEILDPLTCCSVGSSSLGMCSSK